MVISVINIHLSCHAIEYSRRKSRNVVRKGEFFVWGSWYALSPLFHKKIRQTVGLSFFFCECCVEVENCLQISIKKKIQEIMTGAMLFKSVIVIVTMSMFASSSSTDQLDLPPPGIEHRPSTEVGIKATSVDYCLLHSQNWISYTGSYYNSIIGSNVGISSSTYTSSSNAWTVGMTGIPNYDRTFTAANVAALNARPKASSDFRSGATTAVANTWYAFGSDIGYQTRSCSEGYFPPGPVCPAAQTGFSASFPVNPALETGSGCYAFGAAPGIYVTGAPLWSHSDMNTYQNAGVW